MESYSKLPELRILVQSKPKYRNAWDTLDGLSKMDSAPWRSRTDKLHSSPGTLIWEERVSRMSKTKREPTEKVSKLLF